MTPFIISPEQKRTEEDEKRLHITRAIEHAGWSDNEIWMEFQINDGMVMVRDNVAVHGVNKTADYLLARNSHGLAIVEAKKGSKDVGSGMQQALEYAELLDIPFAYSSNGQGFLEHDRLNRVQPERELTLDEFPSPETLWERYCRHKEYSPDVARRISTPYYYDANGRREPRYYQKIAINRTCDAVASGNYPGGKDKRVLLVMATGSGKTYTAFQIIYRLREAGLARRVLYLADRNILIDQTMKEDFKPFSKVMVKVTHKKMDSAFEIYMSLYHQQIADEPEDDTYRQFKPEFFDLIVVDECHRGSADENSNWRRILEYFSGAVQVGMTATPKETKHVSNIDYFGEPLYTYSLKQGIEDGFLAPFKVVQVNLNKDIEGWKPENGQRDKSGKLIPDRVYLRDDFDKEVAIDERTQYVAHRIVEELETIGKLPSGRYQKTMVFCDRVDHAERMRQALVNEIGGEAAENSKYVMRITGDDNEGKAQLEAFNDPYSELPVIATTSDLLTTGVNCKTCQLIVLDKTIQSATEFKQIVGRGTRLYPPANKMYFTILDFKGATNKFADPDFMGNPIKIFTGKEDKKKSYPAGDGNKKEFYRVNNVDVRVVSERIQYYEAGGKLVTESFTDFTKKTVLNKFATLNAFLKRWNETEKREIISDELELHGVFLEVLRQSAGNANIDDFDLIVSTAYGIKPLTRGQRANMVRDSRYLDKYQGVCREVLNTLLEKYQDGGDAEISMNILNIPDIKRINSPVKIIGEFGGKDKFLNAVYELRCRLYSVPEAA